MLKLLNSSHLYGKKTIYIPEIRVKKGEIVGLFGPSGCGKSTAAAMLAGIIKPIAGIIEVPPRDRCKNSAVQWISQRPELAFNPRWRLQRSLDESYRVSNDLLARYCIEPEWLERRPAQLSGGELQRINIVRALSQDTEYLLCDEITAQLDPITQREIWQQLLEDIKQRQLGVLVISHSLPLLNNICTKVIHWENH